MGKPLAASEIADFVHDILSRVEELEFTVKFLKGEVEALDDLPQRVELLESVSAPGLPFPEEETEDDAPESEITESAGVTFSVDQPDAYTSNGFKAAPVAGESR